MIRKRAVLWIVLLTGWFLSAGVLAGTGAAAGPEAFRGAGKIPGISAFTVPGGICAEAAEPEAPDMDAGSFVTDDGHSYLLVVSDCTWSQALERSSDMGGYLVNIGGWTEYSAILKGIIDAGLSDIRFRIGACRQPGSREYHWVDGDGVPYGDVINDPGYWSWSRWITGGPSFYANGFDEEVLEIMYYEKEGRWVWNDVPDDIVASSSYFSGRVGYIVEFDSTSLDELTQSGTEDDFVSYDEITQNGGEDDFVSYDEAAQSGDEDIDTVEYEGPDEIHFPSTVGSDPSGLLSLVPDRFSFSSGVGAWSTDLFLNDDGTFSGVYHDYNAGEDADLYPGGTEYLCVFQGSFTNFRRIDRYTWAMDLSSLSYESEVGDSWVDPADSVHYITSDAQGIAGGDTFFLYLKGHPVSTLPSGFLDWVNSYDGSAETLDTFGIYNESQESGFCES